METFGEAAAWIEANGIEAARRGILPGGVFANKSQRTMSAYLQSLDRMADEAKAGEASELARRNTIAAERSAEAAKKGLPLAKVGAAVTIGLLILAALTYLRP